MIRALAFARTGLSTAALAVALWAAAVIWSPTRPLAQCAPDTGGPFEMIDQDGRSLASSALAGCPFAIFFGFTNCPDVCPTTLLQMSNLLVRLGSDADRLKVLFVSVDPERDTPEQLRAYLTSFDPRIVGLTGSPEQVAATAKAWKAFHNKIPEDGGYIIAHSAYVYLMDAGHKCVGTMGFQDTDAEQLEKLKALLASAPGKSP